MQTIKGLKIQNIGIIEDVDIPFNHPLLLFCGDIGQGKSTILKAIGWLFGGAFPSDIIRHGQKEALIEMTLGDGFIRREFYVGKDDQTKSRDIVFVRGGRPVPRPVSEIKRMLNPFLEDQDYLVRMGETERKAYFSQMFAVDTSVLDKEYYDKDSEASRLRTRIDSYGQIDLTPVPAANSQEIRNEIEKIMTEHNRSISGLRERNRIANGVLEARRSKIDRLPDLEARIIEVRATLEKLERDKADIDQWLKDNPKPTLEVEPPAPDTKVLDTKLEEAIRNEERAKQLEENKKKAEKKAGEEAQLKTIEVRLREIKKAKVAKLAEVSEKSGIPGLEFDEKGVLVYEGTQAGMLSTSQLMRLSSQLSELYPKGLGLELIDRAESLGKSIFDFIDRAKREEKTIMATIVGEAPATTPVEVGVFVVESGKVTQKATNKSSQGELV